MRPRLNGVRGRIAVLVGLVAALLLESPVPGAAEVSPPRPGACVTEGHTGSPDWPPLPSAPAPARVL